ncbi:hypothetical protein ACH4D3_19135 [Streptomyces sp. NPDC018026]|uniref:hypothetical protein n=1 Tax=Streptomyces sp. NPDC018026 TaxID=3365031 RepID=UPI00378F4694
MTGQDLSPVLPVDFLRTAMAGRSPNDPVVQLAAQQARTAQPGHAQSALVEALLSGPYAQEAPLWLLETTVEAGLGAEGEASGVGQQPALVATALEHPSCTASLREQALRRCTSEQLGMLGTPRADARLAATVAAELRARSGAPLPMTPQLLQEPTAAQTVLQQGPLHPLVFEAARDTLPTEPDPDKIGEGSDTDGTWKQYKQAYDAWRSMWRQVLNRHPHCHRELIAWAADAGAEGLIRDELLGSLPWAVEPALLAELARADLDRFSFEVLLARGCRMLRAGSDEQQVLEHFATDLSAVTDDEQTLFHHALRRKSSTLLDMGCHAPITWAQRAAVGTWRHILSPTQAKDGYRPVQWQASAALLTDLATQFAETAACALPYWEPMDRYRGITAREVTWVRDMVLRLPTITEDVRAGVGPLVRDAHERLSYRHPGLQPRHDERSEIQESLNTIERVLADPAPATGVERRRTALGAPDEVTVRDLARLQTQALSDYLTRHAGDDSLVEKALLSCAASGYRSRDDFDNVLRRHSCPDTVLLRLTGRLRTRLGGGPSWREAWTQLVLGRAEADPALVRALPAWTALRARGDYHATAHAAVVTAVREALGSDQEAWDRFAACPATHSGPTAWLRLGDLLDAAAAGSPWPKPPGSR